MVRPYCAAMRRVNLVARGRIGSGPESRCLLALAARLYRYVTMPPNPPAAIARASWAVWGRPAFVGQAARGGPLEGRHEPTQCDYGLGEERPGENHRQS